MIHRPGRAYVPAGIASRMGSAERQGRSQASPSRGTAWPQVPQTPPMLTWPPQPTCSICIGAAPSPGWCAGCPSRRAPAAAAVGPRGLGQPVFLPCAVAVAVRNLHQHASLDQTSQPRRQDVVGDARFSRNASKRVIPAVASRRMSSVQRSPSRSPARPIGQERVAWSTRSLRWAGELACISQVYQLLSGHG